MIKELSEELISFAAEERTVHFIEFARRKGKTQSWLNRMEEDYPVFKDAYRTAKEVLAGKLVKSSIFGDPNCPNFNGTHAMSWMGVYSYEWKGYLKYKADIQKEQPKDPENKCTFNTWKEEQKNKTE